MSIFNFSTLEAYTISLMMSAKRFLKKDSKSLSLLSNN